MTESLLCILIAIVSFVLGLSPFVVAFAIACAIWIAYREWEFQREYRDWPRNER